MPILEKHGDLLQSECNILVNTVNCVGVMGKGIALDFKRKFPSMFKTYRDDCKRGIYKPGCIKEYLRPDGIIIINFATKDHWRDPSNITWIENGLTQLHSYLLGTTYSIAIPALGCSNGHLNWSDVKPLIYQKLDTLNNHIELYLPI